MCLCTGNGLVVKTAAQNLARAILKECPPKIFARSLLVRSRLVIETGGSLWQIAIMYLKPVRPTYLQVKQLEGEAYGRRCVAPLQDDDSGKCIALRCIHMVDSLPLESELHCTNYRLVGFDKIMKPWWPSRRLTIEPLDYHCPVSANPFKWWPGRAAVEKEMQDKEDRKRADAARRAARQAAGEQKTAKRKPRSENKSGSKPKGSRKRKSSGTEEGPLPLENWEAPDENPPDSGEEFWGGIAELHFGGELDGDESKDFVEPWAEACPKEDIVDRDIDDLFGDQEHMDFVRRLGVRPESEAPASEYCPDEVAEELFGGSGEDSEDEPDQGGKKPEGAEPTLGQEPKPDHESREPVIEVDVEGDTGGSEGPSDAESSSAPRAKKRRSKPSRPRRENTMDFSSAQPRGCTLRRYNPPDERPYWHGVLPPGVTDFEGRHTRRRGYGTGLRPESTAIADIEAWLLFNVEEGSEDDQDGKDEGEEAELAEDDADSE